MKRFAPVSMLPYVEGVLTKERLREIQNSGIYGKQPKNMDYRIQFIKGYGASTRDKTWNKKKHIHTCCGSPVAWRHRAKCDVVLKAKGPDDLSDLKDI